MRTIPKNRQSILYINAVEEAPIRSGNKELTKEDLGVKEINDYLLEIEKKLRMAKSIHEELADIGIQLSQAVMEGRDQDANQSEAAYYALAISHAHVDVMKEVPQLIRELSAI